MTVKEAEKSWTKRINETASKLLYLLISAPTCYQERADAVKRLSEMVEEDWREECRQHKEMCDMPIDEDSEFYRTYDRLSDSGICDGAGGMEYRRVYMEWVEAGSPKNIAAFIKRGANAST